jgi:hypothetical protein
VLGVQSVRRTLEDYFFAEMAGAAAAGSPQAKEWGES